MSNRDITFYIVDIFVAIDKVDRYTKDFNSGTELLHSEMHWDATIRELEIIGEATKYLLEGEIIDKQYRRIVDFRNQVIHGYFGIDENIVWDVVQNKLVEYFNDLKTIIINQDIELDQAIAYAKDEYSTQNDILDTLNTIEKLLCK